MLVFSLMEKMMLTLVFTELFDFYDVGDIVDL